MPGANGTYYWRVYAVDDPGNALTDYISAQVNSFTYVRRASPQPLTPANGATTSRADPDLDAGRGRGQVLRDLVTDLRRRRLGPTSPTPRRTPRATALTVRPHLPLVRARPSRIDGTFGRRDDAAGASRPSSLAAQAAPTAIAPTRPAPSRTPNASRPSPGSRLSVRRRTTSCTCARPAGRPRTTLQIGGDVLLPEPPRTPATTFLDGGPNSTSQRYDWYVDAYNGTATPDRQRGAIGHVHASTRPAPQSAVSGPPSPATRRPSGPEGITPEPVLPPPYRVPARTCDRTPVLALGSRTPNVGFVQALPDLRRRDQQRRCLATSASWSTTHDVGSTRSALPGQPGRLGLLLGRSVPCSAPNVVRPDRSTRRTPSTSRATRSRSSPVTTDPQHAPPPVSNDVTLVLAATCLATEAERRHRADTALTTAGAHRGAAVPGPGRRRPRLPRPGDRRRGRRPDDLHRVRNDLPGGQPVLAGPGASTRPGTTRSTGAPTASFQKSSPAPHA